MKYAEFLAVVAAKADTSSAKADAVLKAAAEAIQESIKSGDSVALSGLGSFSAVDRPARQARNPRTGDMIDVPAKKVPVFKAGKVLKDVIAG